MPHPVAPRSALPEAAPLTLPDAGSPRPAVLRGRIGSGFAPVPHRYHLYLCAQCPLSRSVSRALVLLDLEGSVPRTLLGPDPGDPDDPGRAALRRAYEAAGHRHPAPSTAPALCDTWSGRVVTNHTPDILDGLLRLSTEPAFRGAP
ncbi:hypothetical protein [Streptomyces sp. NPDC091268]|uniref:hypothetical protein n=1 Tax=Streptomyces sp. NPDC091268 TaxID=3365979 RepID=UPI003825A88F